MCCTDDEQDFDTDLPGSTDDEQDLDTAHDQQSALLKSFIAQLSQELTRVTHLHITLPYACGPATCEEEEEESTYLTELLLPLASSFPHLVQLAVSGRVGPSIFQAFGSLCPQLNSLCASLSNLGTSTLQQLPELLPSLTSLGVMPACACEDDGLGPLLDEEEIDTEDEDMSIAAACIALQACTSLRSFDTTTYNMTAELWAALPLGMVNCATAGVGRHCYASPFPQPVWQQHLGLKRLTINKNFHSVQDLGSLLSAAPNLSSISVKRCEEYVLSVHHEHGLHEALFVFNARLDAGLQVYAIKAGILETAVMTQPALLHTSYGRSGHHISPVFSASMPVSPRFRALKVRGRGLTTTEDVLQLARMFPCLRDIKFVDMVLDTGALQYLAACLDLKSVEMRCCQGVTLQGVAALCAASTSLGQVTCRACKDISVRDKRKMQRNGWGGAVKVQVI